MKLLTFIFELLAALAVYAALYGAIGWIVGRVARRKGYDFWRWFFALGPFAFLVLAVLPNLNSSNHSDESREVQRQKGNRIGEGMSLLFLVGFAWFFFNVARDNFYKMPNRRPVMTLEDAGSQLAEVAGQQLRQYSTFDFGRERNSEARSVVVPSEESQEVLEAIRQQVGPKLIAFIGTTRWLGDEQHEGGEEIVVANGESQLDILRVAHSDAVNYDMETEDLVKKLTEFDQSFGIDIFHAETDTIEFRLRRMPENMPAFCEALYEFCPDIVDQGTGTVNKLQQEITRTKQVFLWWD